MTRQRIGETAKFRAAFARWGIGVLCAVMLWGVGCGRNSSEYSQFPPNAEGLFLAGIRPPAGDTDRLLRNAHYLKLMGRPEMALRELEAACQQDPKNIRVLNTLALAYDGMGEFNRAQELYQKALALDVSNQTLNNNLCFSHYLAGQWDKAESCFRQALTRNPRNIMARNNLGLLLCRRGRTAEARRLWEEGEGKIAAEKKVQQVMALLGMGESPHYAQLPESAPAATAPVPQSSTPAPAVAQKMPPAGTVQPSPAPRPQVPVAAPATAREPMKIAANPGPAASLPDRCPSTPVATARPAPPQPEKPAAAVRTPRQPDSVAKSAPSATPAAARKITAPPVLAAAPAKPQPPPAPPKRAAEPEKKANPAVKPPPSVKPGKIKLTAAPALGGVTPEGPAPGGIEVDNGSGAHNLARQTRAVLQEEGFDVVSIGNYRDFGVEKTTIYYRPEAEKMARTLKARFFPESRLETGEKFEKNAAVRIVLGKDLQGSIALIDKSSPAADKVAAAVGASPQKPRPQPAASAAPAPAAAPQPVPAKTAAQAPEPPSAKVQDSKGVSKPYLTAAELVNTAIEIRNGSGAHNIAHKARTMLVMEGFNVARIGNHIDFGAETTVIYYRPAAEKVARNLSAEFFSHCRLEQTARLPEDIAVKVLLGKDLLQRTDVMARLEE